jgi:hypothetical protein
MAKNLNGQNSNSFTFDFDNMSTEDIEKAALEQMGGDEDLENENEEIEENLEENQENESEEEPAEENEDSNQEDDQDPSEEINDEEDVKENQSEKQEEPAPQTEEHKKEFGDRANKRIRQLNSQMKQALETATLAVQDAEKERKERYESEKEKVRLHKELLQFKSEKLQRDFAQYAQDGDFAKQAEVNAEMAKVGTQLAAIESIEKKYAGEYKPEPKQYVTQHKQAESNDFAADMEKATELAKEWEFENPRVLADENYKKVSHEVGKILLSKGFKLDSPDFYKELTTRMNKAFGTTSQEKEESKVTTEKKVVAKKPLPAPKQAVSGASRTPSPGSSISQAKNGSRVVNIKQDDIDYAKRNGIPLKQFARDLARAEKSKNSKGGYSLEVFPDE